MENSHISSMGEPVPPEESGWTAYFEDFSNNNKNDIVKDIDEGGEKSFCSSFCSSSLVSDAASYYPATAWRLSHKTPKKLNFKKTRTKEISVLDDSLEDTASSPANSPKVGDLRLDMKNKQDDDLIESSLRKGGISDKCYSELEAEESTRVDFNGGKTDCIELKKRGLCLVPLSMLVNYLG
ncbi:hypothetical protein UlMin_022903 [Ulmus minor]